MPYAEDPVRLWFDRRGRGEPLLWITGFGLSGRAFEPVLSLYEVRFNCVIYDPRGAGRSAAPLRPATMATLAADAVSVLDAAGIDRAHVYGVSWGGLVAQELALRHPERVRALVVGGAPPIGLTEPVQALAHLPARAVLGAGMLSAWTLGRWPGALETVLTTRDFRRRHPAEAAALVGRLSDPPPRPQGVVGQALAILSSAPRAQLRQLQAPTLVCRGEHDALVPLASARLLADLVPGAELRIVPGAGHAYLLERPDDAFALLTDWIERRG